jgi:hypothetical protein
VGRHSPSRNNEHSIRHGAGSERRPTRERSDDRKKDLHSLLPREEHSKTLETATSLETRAMTLTAEDTMDAEQEGGISEGMTVDADGPFNSTEHTRERRGGQAATTTPSNVPRTETDIAMEGTGPKQHKDYKVSIRSSPLTPDEELPPFLPPTNPKRNKKLKPERDMSLPRERTRSKPRNITRQRLYPTHRFVPPHNKPIYIS